MKTFIILWLSFGFLFFIPFAEGVQAQELPQKIPRGQAKRLFIVGFAGQVTVNPSKTQDVQVSVGVAPKPLAVRLSPLGDTIEVRSMAPGSSATDWAQWAQGKGVPQAKIEISAPDSMFLDIYWARGEIRVPSWKGPVGVTSQEADINLNNIVGDVTVKNLHGAIKLNGIKGNVNIDNFASHVKLNDITGHLKVTSFAGETVIHNISGSLALHTQSASVQTEDTSGQLELDSGNSRVRIEGHRGSLSGRSDSGSITAKILGTVDTRLSSQGGSLSLTVPHDCKANVTLISKQGQIKAPKTLTGEKSASESVIRGQLQGSQPGQLRLNSENGDVTLKVL